MVHQEEVGQRTAGVVEYLVEAEMEEERQVAEERQAAEERAIVKEAFQL